MQSVSASGPVTGWRRAWRMVGVAASAGLAVVVLPFTGATPFFLTAFSDFLQLGAAAAAAILLVAMARRCQGADCAGWMFLGAGAFAWTVGQILWTWYELVLRQEVPSPGLNDVAYLAMVPLAVAGLLLLSPLRQHKGLVAAALLLDGALATLAVAAIAWPLVLYPVFHAQADLAPSVVAVAYPMGDLIILGLAGGILMRSRAAWRSALGLAYAGFFLISVADIGYALGIFSDTYATGQLVDAGWITGFLVLAAAALAPSRQLDAEPNQYARRVGHLIPLAALIAGIAGFVIQALAREQHPVDTGWLVLISLLGIAAVARQALTEIEYRVLLHDREAAQRLYRDIVEGATEGIFRTNETGQILMANPEYAHIAGYASVEELQANVKRVTELYVDPNERDVLLDAVRRQGRLVGQEIRIRRADGQLRWISVNLQATTTSTDEREYEGFVRDVTDAHVLAHNLERTRRALIVLSQVNQALAQADDETVLVQRVCDLLVKDGGYRLAWAGLAQDDEARSVKALAQAGFETGYVDKVRASWGADDPRGQGPTGRAIRDGKTQVAQDILNDPTMAPWRDDALARGYRASCSMVLDLKRYGRGALMVYADEPTAFGPDEVQMLDELAGDLAFGMVALRNRQATRKAEEARVAAQADYQALFEHMTEGVAHCRMVFEGGKPVDWEYLHVNPAFTPLTGLRDVVGRRVTEVIPGLPESNPDLLALYERAAKGGAPERIETEVPGLGRWFSISAYSPAPDEFVAVFDDVTERKRAETTLRISEARLREAQRTAHVGSWELDLVKNELWWSDENYRVFGVEPGVFGATYEFFLDTIHPDDREAVNKAYTTSVATRIPYGIEHRLVMKDGSVKWVYERCETFYSPTASPSSR
ncbi:MAG: PAS domain S-box protein, partial [Candidatus Thermoplasmatota archaeon]